MIRNHKIAGELLRMARQIMAVENLSVGVDIVNKRKNIVEDIKGMLLVYFNNKGCGVLRVQEGSQNKIDLTYCMCEFFIILGDRDGINRSGEDSVKFMFWFQDERIDDSSWAFFVDRKLVKQGKNVTSSSLHREVADFDGKRGWDNKKGTKLSISDLETFKSIYLEMSEGFESTDGEASIKQTSEWKIGQRKWKELERKIGIRVPFSYVEQRM